MFVRIAGIIIAVLLLVTVAQALRITRPTVFQLPWTEEQINDLNNTLEQLFQMNQGRYEFDIETTEKTNAKNGELWIISSGGVARIQIKALDGIYTFTPDGY